MDSYGLIGYPLGHSLSPQIHQRLFGLEGLDRPYSLLAFPPEELPGQIGRLRQLRGFNITIPYKQALFPYLAGLDGRAAFYHSVNTVSVQNGEMTGYNTDCIGFLRTMQSHNVRLDGSVCVVGAGGVGRMFALEAAREGAQVTVAVRAASRAKGEALAEEILQKCGVRAQVAASETLDAPFSLLINATPVGMFPQVDACPVSERQIAQCAVVFDCIYNPRETLLMRRAKMLGAQVVGGMDMLVWQAAIAHEIWHGSHFTPEQIDPITAEMEQLLAAREAQA